MVNFHDQNTLTWLIIRNTYKLILCSINPNCISLLTGAELPQIINCLDTILLYDNVCFF